MTKCFKNPVFSLIMVCTSLFYAQPAKSQSPGFVKVKNQHFYIDNKPYYYIGANYWYGGLLALQKDPARGKERLIKELDFLKSNGITNLRVLVGAEGAGQINGVSRVKPALQTEMGVYNDDILIGLDFFLSEMNKRKMYAVLYLSNNWEWSGGFLQYLNWHGLIDRDILKRKLTWDEQRDYTSKFYTCAPCLANYKDQVEHVLNHVNKITGKPYTEEPAIMAWELANEPRPMRPGVITEYKAWINATAEFIKSKDKNHLVTIGSEGMMGTEENPQLFKEIHQFSAVDYLTIHIWPKNWSWFTGTDVAAGLKNSISKTLDYIQLHEQLAEEIKKPLVIEEFGMPRDGHSFDPTASTQSRDVYYESIFKAFAQSRKRSGAVAGVNFWAFGGTSRPVKGQLFWQDGDDFSGDPPQEEQGLNTVFDGDLSTWKIIRSFSKSIK